MATKTKTPSSKAILDRANRMAKRQVNKVVADLAEALGVEADSHSSLLEAVKAAKSETQSTNENASALEAKYARLKEEHAKLQNETTKVRQMYRKAEKERRKYYDDLQEHLMVSEIKDSARAAGVRDEDYAVHLFRSHVLSDGEYSEQPGNFFESLKTDQGKKFLFDEELTAAGPSSLKDQLEEQKKLDPANAPDEEQASGEEQQKAAEGEQEGSNEGGEDSKITGEDKAAEGNAQGGDVNSFEMEKKDFQDHVHDKYGFRPPMSL